MEGNRGITRPNYSGLSFRDLEYVVAVADHGSFVRAAKHCHVTQPSLSLQIRRIEERLGSVIFDRSQRGTSVTTVGRLLVEQMRRALSEARALFALAEAPVSAFNGVLRLSAIPSLAPYFFPRALPGLRATFPGVRFVLSDASNEYILRALAAGDIDAGIVSGRPQQRGIVSQLLRNELLWTACPEDHPAAQLGGPGWLQLTATQRIPLDNDECSHGLPVRAGYADASSRVSMTVDALLYRVAAGEGCALIPAFALRPVEGVVYLPSTRPERHRELWLAWRADTVHVAAMAELATCLAGISP
jgi:LysR family hydrogen peroxide-inducible transcriptional activator